MNGAGRDEAPFNGRVWQEIDQAVGAVRAANVTARRFLTVDGPYGMGLTSVAGDEGWLPPGERGATPDRWNVARPHRVENGDSPRVFGDGTYLVRSEARPVPLIASEFALGMRSIEAFEAGCQPLDICRATAAARDVALEEERLLYYGSDGDDALLRIIPGNSTFIGPGNLLHGLHAAMNELARRGYAGPFALAVWPVLYSVLYTPITRIPGAPAGRDITSPVLLVDLLRNLFRGGVFMVPVIDPRLDAGWARAGAIVTVGSAYSRLVVGQDWVTAYRGRLGVLHRFIIMSSLQLRICDPRSIQVLQVSAAEADLDVWLNSA